MLCLKHVSTIVSIIVVIFTVVIITVVAIIAVTLSVTICQALYTFLHKGTERAHASDA